MSYRFCIIRAIWLWNWSFFISRICERVLAIEKRPNSITPSVIISIANACLRVYVSCHCRLKNGMSSFIRLSILFAWTGPVTWKAKRDYHVWSVPPCSSWPKHIPFWTNTAVTTICIDIIHGKIGPRQLQLNKRHNIQVVASVQSDSLALHPCSDGSNIKMSFNQMASTQSHIRVLLIYWLLLTQPRWTA